MQLTCNYMSENIAFSSHWRFKDHLAYTVIINHQNEWGSAAQYEFKKIHCIETQSRKQLSDGFDRAYKYHGNWAETLILECFRIIRNKSITLFLYVRLCGKSSKNTT